MMDETEDVNTDSRPKWRFRYKGAASPTCCISFIFVRKHYDTPETHLRLHIRAKRLRQCNAAFDI